MSKYKEQYERVLRWYQRFKNYNKGILHDKDSNYYLDEIYAFFINCYHLKDWVKNDNTNTIDVGDIESFINNSRNICADLCNGLKHLELTRFRVDRDTKFGKKNYQVGLGTQPTTIAVKIEIIADNNNYDAFDLASDCIKDWEKYLKLKNLI